VERFARLLDMLERDEINARSAKEVLLAMLSNDQPPDEIVEAGQYRQVSDSSELDTIIDGILAEHVSDVEDYRNGNAKVMGFLMGLAMKASEGKANPKLLREMLLKRLG
jgi:aspartyl-tRNA(Asn)/glutamyl-tRNA(Gln) amidotransferase subunit B